MHRPMIQVSLLATLLFCLSSCGAKQGTKTGCPETCTAACCQGEFKDLFASDLSNATLPANSWTYADGVLELVGKGSIWTHANHGDFVLDLEFKVDQGTNSGVFIRTGDIKNNVQTGIEIQVYDSFGKDPVGKHDCGAVYDCLAPSKNSVKEAGRWNHMTLEAQGAMLTVILNDEQIINMNLDDWREPRLNPDRSKNKFKTALRDFPRTGRIGFQDHGKKVWYRNIRIKPLAP